MLKSNDLGCWGTKWFLLTLSFLLAGLWSGCSSDTQPVMTPSQAAPSSFVASVDGNQVALSWSNPDSGEFAGVMLRRSNAGFSVDPNAGVEAYNGTGNRWNESGLAPGIYYYSLFAFDRNGNFSAPVQVAITIAVQPPGQIANLQVSQSGGDLTFTWANPASPDFAGVSIRYATAAFPATPADGEEIYSGIGETFHATGLPVGVNYFAFFAYDQAGEYSPPLHIAVNITDTAPPARVRGISRGQARHLNFSR